MKELEQDYVDDEEIIDDENDLEEADEEQDEPSLLEIENQEYWDNVLSPQVDYLNRR